MASCLSTLALFATGCGDSPTGTPPKEAGIRVVASPTGTDTIEATPAQPLVVEVRGPNGRLQVGAIVRMTGAQTMQVAKVGSGPFGPEVIDTTDAQGRAEVRVGFGRIVGSAPITITAQALGMEQVVPFAVLPGAPASARLAPRDTAAYVGATLTLRAAVKDRFGNPLPAGAGVFSAGTPQTSVNAQGTVRGEAIGRTYVVLHAGTSQDTAWVTVVPTGTIAAGIRDLGPDGLGRGVVVFNLDGSGLRRLVTVATGDDYIAPYWTPDGTSLLYHTGPRGRYQLRRVTLQRNDAAVLVDGSLVSASWAETSPDGKFIYFGGTPTFGVEGTLWRADSDGSNLVAQNALPGGVVATNPTLSPTGNRAAFITRGFDGVIEIRVLDLTSRAVTRLAAGHTPRWSPNSERIAFVRSGGIFTIYADGSGLAQLTPAGRYGLGIDWSPDGQWIVASRTGGTVDLINAQSGAALSLPFSIRVGEPSWKP